MAADQAHQLMVVEGGEIITREYRKGNWTLQETMVLIEAKRMDKERRTKRGSSTGGGSGAAGGGRPSELRWKWVEDYCWRHGCHRSQNQCNDKWDNLMRDYKKVRNYEEKVAGEGGERSSYWKLESHERKERNLPSNFLPQVYEALYDVVERRGSGGPHGALEFAAAAEESLMGGVSSFTSLPLLVQQPPSAPAQMPSLPPPPIPAPPPPQESLLPHPQILMTPSIIRAHLRGRGCEEEEKILVEAVAEGAMSCWARPSPRVLPCWRRHSWQMRRGRRPGTETS